MYEITAIKISSNPPSLGVISDYLFQGRNGETNTWVEKPEAVKYVAENPNTVYVSGGGALAYVDVVANGANPYLRTRSDDSSTDNLLSLPIYN